MLTREQIEFLLNHGPLSLTPDKWHALCNMALSALDAQEGCVSVPRECVDAAARKLALVGKIYAGDKESRLLAEELNERLAASENEQREAAARELPAVKPARVPASGEGCYRENGKPGSLSSEVIDSAQQPAQSASHQKAAQHFERTTVASRPIKPLEAAAPELPKEVVKGAHCAACLPDQSEGHALLKKLASIVSAIPGEVFKGWAMGERKPYELAEQAEQFLCKSRPFNPASAEREAALVRAALEEAAIAATCELAWQSVTRRAAERIRALSTTEGVERIMKGVK